MLQHLSSSQYANLLSESHILLLGKRGPRLIETPEGDLVKLFPQRKWISSNRIFPYAKRFVANALQLSMRGIATIKPINYGKVAGTTTYYVKYAKLPGQDLRDYLQNGGNFNRLNAVARFVAILHQRGVFFRGIHLGNILQMPDEEFALLDIVAMRFKSKPLSTKLRKRNLQHLLSYPEDVNLFQHYGINHFLNEYINASNLTLVAQQHLQHVI